MPKTQRQSDLKTLLDKSRGVQILLPSYREVLYELAETEDTAEQGAISIMLKREKPNDLQSVYFTENILSQFIEHNFPPQNQEKLLEEYKEKTKQLIRTFLFMDTEEKNKILPRIDGLNLPQLKELIELYKMGHNKQAEYLRIFAEKDPKSAIKFKFLVNKRANEKENEQKKVQNI